MTPISPAPSDTADPATSPNVDQPRRSFLLAGPALAATLSLGAQPASAQTSTSERWSATWGTAPAGPPPSANTIAFSSQTLRLIVRASVGGSRVRIRVSNEMGSSPLRIGAACIGLRASGLTVASGARTLTFGGAASITIPAGAPAVSDPVDLNIPAFSDLAVSLYLPGSSQATTIHDAALQTSYVSTAGDFSASPSFPQARTLASWPFLTEVDVAGANGAVVTLGDSITDGARSTANANRRWPDYLARRLQAELGTAGRIGVVNRGISANCLLTDYNNALLAGRDALERFDRDVLATAGVRYLAILLGINDICYSSGSSPIPASDIIAGYRQLINRARMRGLAVLCATLMPFEGFVYYTAARENVRQAVNNWLRSTREYDALADFDLVMRDPARPVRLLPAYDGGDRLHPNDAGYQAMANAVPLSLFTSFSSAQADPAPAG
jgi:lysophospholipase L1-like esterase